MLTVVPGTLLKALQVYSKTAAPFLSMIRQTLNCKFSYAGCISLFRYPRFSKQLHFPAYVHTYAVTRRRAKMYSEVKNAACMCNACKYTLTHTRSSFGFIRNSRSCREGQYFCKQLQIPAYIRTQHFALSAKTQNCRQKKRQAAAGIPAAGAHCACCEGTTQNPACMRAVCRHRCAHGTDGIRPLRKNDGPAAGARPVFCVPYV